MRGRGMVAVLALLSLLAGAGSTATADTWILFRNRRIADRNGRYYAVVKRKVGGGATYVIAERGEGQPPVTRIIEDAPGLPLPPGFRPRPPAPAEKAEVRSGDRVIASGGLPHEPLQVLVSDRGIGIVAVGHHGMMGSGPVVVIVSARGRIRHRKELTDLFPHGEVSRFRRSVSSAWWFRRAFIDDETDEVVIVARDGSLRVVSLHTGEVGPGTAEHVLRVLDTGSTDDRKLACEILTERRVKSGRELLIARFEDGAEAPGLRLRAAVALATVHGDRRGGALLVECSRPSRNDTEENDRRYAIRNLPEVLGKRAVVPLIQAARREPHEVILAFVRLGDPGVRALIEQVEKHDRWWAASALGRLGSRRALPALLRAMARRRERTPDHESPGADESLAYHALLAAISIADEEIKPDLIALRERGTPVDDAIDEALTMWK